MTVKGKGRRNVFDIQHTLPKEFVLHDRFGGCARRGLVAKNAYKTGEIISTFEPIIQIPYSFSTEGVEEYRANLCGYCHSSSITAPLKSFRLRPTANGLLACGGCSLVRYCSEKCYGKDRLHKWECLYFQRYCVKEGSVPLELLRVIVRLIIWCAQSKANFMTFCAFTTHIDEFKHHNETRECFSTFEMLERYFPELEEFKTDVLTSAINGYITRLDIPSVAAAVLINSLTLLDTFNMPLGLVFDPLFAFMNHSCCSNVTFICEGHTAKAVATRTIEPGEPVTMSYCYQSLPKFLRQNILSNRYLFECKCELCSEAIDRRLSLQCPQCGTSSGPDFCLAKDREVEKAHYKCLCGSDNTVTFRNAYKLYSQLVKLYWKLCSGEPTEAPLNLLLTEERYYSSFHYPPRLEQTDSNTLQRIIEELKNGGAASSCLFPVGYLITAVSQFLETHEAVNDRMRYALMKLWEVDLHSDEANITFAHSLRDFYVNGFSYIEHAAVRWPRERSASYLQAIVFAGLHAKKQLFKYYSKSSPVMLSIEGLAHAQKLLVARLGLQSTDFEVGTIKKAFKDLCTESLQELGTRWKVLDDFEIRVGKKGLKAHVHS